MLVTMWLLLVHGKQEFFGVGPVCDMGLPRFQQSSFDMLVTVYVSVQNKGGEFFHPMGTVREMVTSGSSLLSTGKIRQFWGRWQGRGRFGKSHRIHRTLTCKHVPVRGLQKHFPQ